MTTFTEASDTDILMITQAMRGIGFRPGARPASFAARLCQAHQFASAASPNPPAADAARDVSPPDVTGHLLEATSS